MGARGVQPPAPNPRTRDEPKWHHVAPVYQRQVEPGLLRQLQDGLHLRTLAHGLPPPSCRLQVLLLHQTGSCCA